MSRELAAAFSTRTLRELSRANPAPWAYQRAATVAAVVADDAPLWAAFDAAYEQLVDDYRCEYVYKNMVIQHCLEADPNANAMTGLPVFLSIADVVVAGNCASAFEVKTDLDSFTRLDLQLYSYSRCFEYVYVVVSSARASARAVQELPDHVGVLSLADNTKLLLVRPAAGGTSRLDMTSLFRVLRQNERLAILHRQFGYAIDVPSAQLYRRMAGLFMRLPIDVAYREFEMELRNRDAHSRIATQAAVLPRSLTSAAAGLTLSAVAWRRLGALLQLPAGQLSDMAASGARNSNTRQSSPAGRGGNA